MLSALLIMKTGSFATISDGRCGLIDWLAFFNEETRASYSVFRLVIGGSGWGTVFFLLLFSAAARLVSHGKWLFR